MVLGLPLSGFAQSTITGTVTDEASGETLPGVNVIIQGTSKGAATNADGQYQITGLEAGTYNVLARFVWI
ncbi:MAG: carboxypeptidase-like regulatory domain-containing protein [Balneolaceae bacterium]|nr:carboxypeptidase-like regulatory domain-containing protein [Balneolaceae bacterium]